MDAAIIGGGPAGAWTAYQLARRGARVTIFDGSHPREKPCGGGVTARALAQVRAAIDPTRLAATPIRRVRFTAAGTVVASVPLDRDALVVATRESFDAALLSAAIDAGATHVASRVVDVTVSRSGAAIRVRGEGAVAVHRADFVVGADGANSLVRKKVAGAFRRDQLSIATGFFARGVSGSDIAIEFTGAPPGYIWSFPRPDHLAIGICAPADDSGIAALRARAAAWIRDSGIARGAQLVAYSWPIPSLSAADLRRLPVSGDRWCLVGDAAGLVDPITREGIHFAIASGAFAAAAIGSRGARAAYRAQVDAGIVDELARAARVQSRFFDPAFTMLLLAAIEGSAAIRAVIADLVAGRQDYRSLKWRLLRTGEVRLAVRALALIARSSRRGPALEPLVD